MAAAAAADWVLGRAQSWEHQLEAVTLSWVQARHCSLGWGSPLWLFITWVYNGGFLTWVAKSRATLVGMPLNDGNLILVAKMQLEVEVALFVFCTAEGSVFMPHIWLLELPAFSSCIHSLLLGGMGK